MRDVGGGQHPDHPSCQVRGESKVKGGDDEDKPTERREQPMKSNRRGGGRRLQKRDPRIHQQSGDDGAGDAGEAREKLQVQSMDCATAAAAAVAVTATLLMGVRRGELASCW